MIKKLLLTLCLLVTLVTSASAQFPFPINHFSAPVADQDFLDATLSSTEFELIAEVAVSYDTGVDSQKWFNVTGSPASGASKSDYHTFLGADGDVGTDEPAFNGTVGTAGAKWDFDGSNDFFSLVSGSNTTFLNELHNTTAVQDFWFAVVWKNSDVTWQGGTLLSTKEGSGTSAGLFFQQNTSEGYQLRQASGGGSTVTASSSAVSNPSDKQLIIVSHSHSTDNTRFWANTGTAENVAHVFDTGTVTPPSPMTIATRTDEAFPLPSEASMFWIASGNEFLDDTKAGTMITYLEAIFGDLTP